jgi:hypothetical protein
VSQISPPIRIALVLAVAVLGVYMLFLRPKPVEAPPPAPAAPNLETDAPAVSQPGKLAEKAQDAAKASEDHDARVQKKLDEVDGGEVAPGTAGAAKVKPGAPAAAGAVAADLKGLPKPVAAALRKRQVLVLLFWNGRSADDKAVHAALEHVDRWNGRVSVQSAPISRIARYGRIARGVDVQQSPTVVVADPNLRAETLVGYVDAATINQTVVDALRSGGVMFTSSYLRAVDKACWQHGNALHAIPDFYGGGSMRRADRRVSRYLARYQAFVADFRAVKAPKKYAAFKAASLNDLAAGGAVMASFSSTVTPSASVAAVVAAERRYKAMARPIEKRFNRRFDAQGLYRCGSQF